MEILAHRGLWHNIEERNSFTALKKAVKEGFGIETDIRDYCGRLVISHDIANETCLSVGDLISFYIDGSFESTLALNIKADGLQGLIENMVVEKGISNYFLFDMSVPEMVVNKERNLKFFTRHSDIEEMPVMYEYSDGVWLDSFYKENWISAETIEKHLNNHKRVCMISPEIHGFSNLWLWEELKEKELFREENLLLCTDKPIEAREYFI